MTVALTPLTLTAISAASDLIIALYPAFIIWQLKITKRLKTGLSVLMGLGCLSAVCAVFKITTLPLISNTSDPTCNSTQSTTYRRAY